MISLQQFRVLLAVREHGSLTRAAEALGYGVPTVTHHVNVLEHHLRVKLLERDRHGTTMTPLGEAFAIEAAQILSKVDQAERMVADQRDAGLLTLRIGTFASIGSRILPKAIGELQQLTSVRVEVVEAEPSGVVQMLLAGEVHAGLIYDFADDPAFELRDLVLTPLLHEPFRVMVSSRSPLADKDILDFAELQDAQWVFSRSDDEASGRVLRRTCRSVGHEPRELMRTDDLNMIHGLVAQGLGLALTTEMAADFRFDVVLRPAVQNLGERRVSYATRTGTLPAAITHLGTLLATITAST